MILQGRISLYTLHAAWGVLREAQLRHDSSEVLEKLNHFYAKRGAGKLHCSLRDRRTVGMLDCGGQKALDFLGGPGVALRRVHHQS